MDAIYKSETGQYDTKTPLTFQNLEFKGTSALIVCGQMRTDINKLSVSSRAKGLECVRKWINNCVDKFYFVSLKAQFKQKGIHWFQLWKCATIHYGGLKLLKSKIKKEKKKTQYINYYGIK